MSVTAARTEIRVRTNSAPQDEFVFGGAFETLYGGKAGGGKSVGLVMGAVLGVAEPGYSAVLFRRTFPQLTGKGGLIDLSREYYHAAGGMYRTAERTWSFPGDVEIRFSHMAHEDDKYDHQGKRYHFVGFDELSHFTESQYLYLFSRIRKSAESTTRTRMAAATNPGALWVFERWRPWLDPSHPNPAGPGELRWFKLVGDVEVECGPRDPDGWSRTFIPASYEDNPDIDPQYARNLDLLPYLERQRLKHGDWLAQEGRGTILNQEWFGVVDKVPDGCVAFRFWDFAATEKKRKGDDPDYTATCYLATDYRNFYIRLDRKRVTWQTAKKWVQSTLEAEHWCIHGGEEEGGASGKVLSYELAEIAASVGAGWIPVRPQGDKVARAMRWSALAEQGRVYLLTGGEPIQNVLHEFHSFPDGGHDDMVDAASGAFALVGQWEQ